MPASTTATTTTTTPATTTTTTPATTTTTTLATTTTNFPDCANATYCCSIPLNTCVPCYLDTGVLASCYNNGVTGAPYPYYPYFTIFNATNCMGNYYGLLGGDRCP